MDVQWPYFGATVAFVFWTAALAALAGGADPVTFAVGILCTLVCSGVGGWIAWQRLTAPAVSPERRRRARVGLGVNAAAAAMALALVLAALL